MDKDTKKQHPKSVAVPIKWNIPENIVTRFASNISIQTLENEFKISFFEAFPDINMSLGGQAPAEVVANCVASIIISAEKMPSIVSAFQKHLSAYIEMKKSLEGNT